MVEGGADGAWVEGVVRNESSLEVRGDHERNESTGFSWGDWDVSVRLDQLPRLLGFQVGSTHSNIQAYVLVDTNMRHVLKNGGSTNSMCIGPSNIGQMMSKL
jgi:hypothetical protein